MTPKQKQLYFREWGLARKALINEHYESKEADDRRLEIQAEVLEIEDFDPSDPYHRKLASSKNLNNKALDQVLARFRALSDPANLNAQLRQENQPLKRARVALRRLQHQANHSNDYVDGVAQSMFKRKLEHCTLEQVKAVIAAMNKHRLRKINIERQSIKDLCRQEGYSGSLVEQESLKLFDRKFIHLEASELSKLYKCLCDRAWHEQITSEL